MQNPLYEFVNSLSKNQKKQFRQIFQVESREQGAFRLYDQLLNEKPDNLPLLKEQYKSPQDYSRIKSELFSKLIAFISLKEGSEKHKLSKYLETAQYFYSKDQFSLVAQILRIASQIILKEKLFDEVPGLIEIRDSLPRSYWPVFTKRFRNFLEVDSEIERKLTSFETRFSEWRKMIIVPPPSIPALTILDREIDQQKEQYFSPKNKFQDWRKRSRFLFLQKHIKAKLGQFQSSFAIQKAHLYELEKSPIPAFRKEILMVNELKNYSALLRAQERNIEFLESLNGFSSINFKTPKGKSQAILNRTILLLGYKTDLGIIDDIDEVILFFRRMIPSFQDFFSHKQIVNLNFHYGRFLFIAGKPKLANQILKTLFFETKRDSVFELFFPYVLVIQTLINIEKNHWEAVDSDLASLKRFIKHHQLKYKYFSFLFETISIFEKAPNLTQRKKQLHRVVVNISKKCESPFEQYPFVYFDLKSYLESVVSGKPMAEILFLRNSPKEQRKISFGGI